MDSGNEKYPEVYFCIDQRSFYASVECVLRGLNPMTALLVVADAERSKNTICLAVSVGCKKKGIKNRCRLGDVPSNMGVIVAPPQMQLYIDCAAEIHGVFLKYFAPEDIYVYSIDESFIYVTPYLRMYHLTPRELAAKVIADIRNTVGTLSTCGIGSNLYLAKVALDIQAKHAPDGIAELTQRSYQDLSEKKAMYADYQKAREDMRSLQTAKANVDRILGDNSLTAERESEKDGR